MFFLISGFLLYRPYVAARRAGVPATRLRDYAARRAARIFPAYWLALTVLAIVPGLYGVFSDTWWVYYGLLQIYPIYSLGADCVIEAQGCGLVQSWSLAIELSFYALLPLFAYGMGRLTAGRPRRDWLAREAVVLVGCALGSLLVQVGAVRGPAGLQWTHGTILAHSAWFAMGMGLAVVSVAVSGREERLPWIRFTVRRPLAVWLGAGALFGLLISWLPPTANVADYPVAEHIAQHLLFGVVSALVLLPAIFGDEAGGIPRSVLAHPLLLWLGRISYGIFLWHLVIAFELTELGVLSLPGSRFVNLTVPTLLASVAAAAVSYYLVEVPLMRMTRRRRVSREEARPVSTPDYAGAGVR